MPHVIFASEALGLSPVALLITDISASTSLRRPYCSQTDGKHTFRAAPQTELVTSACILSSEFLYLDALHAPTYLWFYVGALKAVFLSSFAGITTCILQTSAACAFITRDQKLSSSRRLSAQTRHRTHRTRAT